MVRPMSEPTQDDGEFTPGEPGADASGVIPVEVEPPEAPTADAPAESKAAGEPVVAVEPAVEPVVVLPPVDPTIELKEKLAAAEKEKKDNYDRYLRTAADIENMRKRVKREVEDAKFDTKNKVLKEMLPVVDNLERAIEHTVSQGGELDAGLKPIVEGVQLVLRQFTTAFERLDVKPIEAMGTPFDPNQHEAISQQESDQPPGTVVQVLQRGYKAGERLLRPALVVVAKPKAAAE
jgi:molecular chaperone GrpE